MNLLSTDSQVEKAAALISEYRRDNLNPIEKRAFQHGYLIAVASVMNLHHEDQIAEDLLNELGCSKSDMERLELCEYDLKPLRKLYKEISRKKKLRK